MSLPVSAVHAPLSVPKRWLLAGIAVILGGLAGKVVNIEPSDWAYNGLLRLFGFGDPDAQIATLAVGVSLGFVLGLIHLTSI